MSIFPTNGRLTDPDAGKRRSIGAREAAVERQGKRHSLVVGG